MKILFVATKKNQHPEHRELYEMNFLIDVLGFERSLFDLGIVTVAACTPREVNGEKVIIEYIDEYLDEVPYDTDADLVALSAKTSCAPAALRGRRQVPRTRQDRRPRRHPRLSAPRGGPRARRPRRHR